MACNTGERLIRLKSYVPSVMDLPEGSFKCDKVARSSGVSSTGGFRSGGSTLLSLVEVSITIS